MAYAVIELLSLNFALNPLFCKTDVSGSAYIVFNTPESALKDAPFVAREIGLDK